MIVWECLPERAFFRNFLEANVLVENYKFSQKVYCWLTAKIFNWNKFIHPMLMFVGDGRLERRAEWVSEGGNVFQFHFICWLHSVFIWLEFIFGWRWTMTQNLSTDYGDPVFAPFRCLWADKCCWWWTYLCHLKRSFIKISDLNRLFRCAHRPLLLSTHINSPSHFPTNFVVSNNSTEPRLSSKVHFPKTIQANPNLFDKFGRTSFCFWHCSGVFISISHSIESKLHQTPN